MSKPKRKLAPRERPAYLANRGKAMRDGCDDAAPPRAPAKKPATPPSALPPEEDYFSFSEATEKEEQKAASKSANKPAAAKPAVRRSPPVADEVAYEDERKLSRKAKEQIQKDWVGRNRGKAIDAFMAAHRDMVSKITGHEGVMLGHQSHSMILGLPLPSLALEYLLAQDVFPLGFVYQIVGKPGVCKSGLLAEIARWFDAAGGCGSLSENESKFNSYWYQSIMGAAAYNRMAIEHTKSLEHWQRHLSTSLRSTKKLMLGTKEEPGPGRSLPFWFGVDSIMGKLSEEKQEKILGVMQKDGLRGTTGKGHASRDFPIEAMHITNYLKSIPQEIRDWPFVLLLVNHLKLKQDDMGHEVRSKAGGEQVSFQQSFELELRKVGGPKKKIECRDWEGYPIELSCEKDSLGPTGRKIQSRVIWWDEEVPETDGWQQRTVWDWDWSTVHMLNALLSGEKANPRLKANLEAVDFHLDCPAIGDVENLAWSRTLGMTRKDATRWSAVGAMIRKDEALMKKLRRALCINHRPRMSGDYYEQREDMVEHTV